MYVETSKLICNENQLTCFYVTGTFSLDEMNPFDRNYLNTRSTSKFKIPEQHTWIYGSSFLTANFKQTFFSAM